MKKTLRTVSMIAVASVIASPSFAAGLASGDWTNKYFVDFDNDWPASTAAASADKIITAVESTGSTGGTITRSHIGIGKYLKVSGGNLAGDLSEEEIAIPTDFTFDADEATVTVTGTVETATTENKDITIAGTVETATTENKDITIAGTVETATTENKDVTIAGTVETATTENKTVAVPKTYTFTGTDTTVAVPKTYTVSGIPTTGSGSVDTCSGGSVLQGTECVGVLQVSNGQFDNPTGTKTSTGVVIPGDLSSISVATNETENKTVTIAGTVATATTEDKTVAVPKTYTFTGVDTTVAVPKTYTFTGADTTVAVPKTYTFTGADTTVAVPKTYTFTANQATVSVEGTVTPTVENKIVLVPNS
ncbi:MAG: hypothetical protein IJ560_02450 [Alphaproteobacteria bacterium]|nr:hypothetical protein [Alphaproteobacteria bacterium]